MAFRARLWLAGCGCLFLFLIMAILVQKQLLQSFDWQMADRAMRHTPVRLLYPLSLLDTLGSFEVLTVLLLVVAWRWLPKQRLAVVGMYGLGLVVEVLGKTFIYQPNPVSDAPHIDLDVDMISGMFHSAYAFPSGHALRTSFVVVVLLIILWRKGWRRVSTTQLVLSAGLILFWLLMLESRIALMWHWTSDVIGGTFLGTGLALITFALPEVSPLRFLNSLVHFQPVRANRRLRLRK